MTVNYDLGKKNSCITKYVTLFNTRRLVDEILVSKFSVGQRFDSQCFQNKTSAVASDGNFYICDAYFHSGKFPK